MRRIIPQCFEMNMIHKLLVKTNMLNFIIQNIVQVKNIWIFFDETLTKWKGTFGTSVRI